VIPGCNTQVHGSNAKNVSVQLSLSQTSKNAMSFFLVLVFSSTKSENNKAEQVLPGSGAVGPNSVNICE
jgi:hypothetical protein